MLHLSKINKMSDDEKERIFKVIGLLGHIRHQLYVHTHKITILLAASDFNHEATMCDINNALGHASNVLTISRYRIMRQFLAQHPASELNETETEGYDIQLQDTHNVSE